MELWFIILIVTLFFCFFFIRATFTTSHSSLPLPPGPPRVPIIGCLFLLQIPFSPIKPFLRRLHAKHGPIISFFLASRPVIFIADRSLAHQALVEKGAVFSSRPNSLATARRLIKKKEQSLTLALHGPMWRLLRRNITSGILHPTRIKSFSGSRKRVLDTLVGRIKYDSESKDCVEVVDHFQHAIFSVLVLMCFGQGLNEKQIMDVEDVHRRLLSGFNRFYVLNFWPKVSRILFRNHWKEMSRMQKEQDDVLLPLIRARKKAKEEDANENEVYVDTLLDLELPEEKRKLDEGELVSLCSEFLIAGIDTTATALIWIMANLVKYSHIQEKVFEEIRKIMSEREEEDDKKEVKEEDLRKLPYLKAVILEGLRRHPPVHFTIPHAVSSSNDNGDNDDTILNGYLVPKNGIVNFMVAEMGWDPKVWENPMEFKPERFLNGNELIEFDITGTKEIKMIPFGAGRRICPAYNLGMFHLQYLVANLVWNFEWKSANGEVDFSEKQEFTVRMKNPLQVHVTSRR